MARAAAIQSSRPSAAAAAARVWRNIPFHPVRTLSSSPGRTRFSRWSKSAIRARSSAAGGSTPRPGLVSPSRENPATLRMVWPSKLPASDTPHQAASSSISAGVRPAPASTSENSASDQT